MRFLELGVLGKNKMATAYFEDDDSALGIGSQLNWFIYIYNHVGTSQKVIIKVKILNSTMLLPDDQKNQPSPYDSFVELPISMFANQTLLVPFSWGIMNASSIGNQISIDHLLVNNQAVEVTVSDSANSFFRIVFELWVYDNTSEQYSFGWASGDDFSSASIYMSFKPVLH